jgi:hypothetical protein
LFGQGIRLAVAYRESESLDWQDGIRAAGAAAASGDTRASRTDLNSAMAGSGRASIEAFGLANGQTTHLILI